MYSPPGAFVEVRIPGDAMLFRQHAATNGRVVGISDRGHRALDATEQTAFPPLRQHRHVALVQVLKPKAIEHQDDHALGRSLGEGRRA